MSVPIRHAEAEVNGVRLHYAAAGAGPLVLFVHGFPEFWYEWRHQLADFGRDHLAVAPDMRGYNLSSRPTEVAEYVVPKLVEDVRALVERLGHQRFTLVAHDWGGAVAWAFAMMHPGLLERLVVINAPHPAVFTRLLREDPAQQQASQYMLMLRSPQAEAALSADDHQALRQALGDVWVNRFDDEDRRMYLQAWSRPGGLTGGLNWYRAASTVPPAAGAPAGSPVAPRTFPVIDVPTLVIWGEQDRALTVANLDGLDRHVRNLTIRRVPDGTHWLVHEQPELITREIRAFMAGS